MRWEANMKREFNKDIEILRNNKTEILEMKKKTSVSHTKHSTICLANKHLDQERTE